MPPDDDEVVVRGRFEDAISAELDRTARQARETSRALDETGAAGEVAALGMDRASIAAGRLKRELEGVDRAAEQQRLAQLRLGSAEQEAAKIRQKGVLTAAETARVETMLSAARRDAKKAADDLTVAHRTLDRATENVGMRMLRAAASVSFLEKAFTGLRMVATADIFTSLVSGVASLGGAGIAAVAGLAPLLGLVGGIPALGLAALSAFGAISLLTGGLGKAATAISTFGAGSPQAIAALRGMGPASQQAAYDLAGLTGELRNLREEGMREALPYLEGSLNNVRQILPHVRTGFLSVVDAVGDVAQQGTARIATWGADIDTILSRNASLIHTLGGSAIDMLDMTRHVMVAAGPMVQNLAQHFAGEMGRINAWMAENPARMEAFFDRVGDRTLSILHVLGDFSHGIYDIFRGAQPLTDHMGGGITKAAAEFREWAHSAQGQNSIHKFFTDAIPVVDAMMHLIGQIGHSLADLSRNGNAAGMLNEISAILPPLTKVLEIIEKIANTVPGGNSVLALLFLGSRFGLSPRVLAGGVFGAARGAFRFGRGVRGVAGAEESFAGRAGMRLGGRAAMLGGEEGALTLGGEAAAAGAGAGEAAGAAGVGGLIAGEAAVPVVGWVAAGVTAAAVGGYEAYKHWKPFHDLMDATGRRMRDAFGWVEHHAGTIGHALLMSFTPFVDPVIQVVKHFHDIESSAGRIVGHVNDFVTSVRHKAGSLGHQIITLGGLLYTGGPVEAGVPYLVGERGPEIFATAGTMRVIGGDGAELLTSATPGFVLPNESLQAINDLRVRDQAARAVPVAAPVGGDGWTLHPGEHVGGGEFEVRGPGLPPGLPPIVVGPNWIYNDVDLEEAVAAGIRKWERERKDRR